MKVIFAADHAGFELKKELIEFVQELGFEVQDCGAHTLDEEDDYPALIRPAAQAVAASPEDTRAIIIGGSGQGEAMVANRIPGVRAAVYHGHHIGVVEKTREDNDANVLSLGARFVSVDGARQAVQVFLQTPFSGAKRHARRIAAIDQ